MTLFQPHRLPTYASFRANAQILTPGGDVSTSDKDSDHNLLFILTLFWPFFETTIYTMYISIKL